MSGVGKNKRSVRFASIQYPLRHNQRLHERRRKSSNMARWSDDDDFGLFSSDDENTSSLGEQEKTVPLDHCIKQVMLQMRQEIEGRRQEAFATARLISERILGTTNNFYSLFQKYIRTRRDGRVDILDFRALDTDVFQCVVPLRRPVRPQTFMFRHKRPREFPSHRMLLCLNEEIPKVDRIQIEHEWGHCMDNNGIIRPDFVLRWFNKGLRVATDVIQHAREERSRAEKSTQSNFSFDLFAETTKDGTLWIHVRNCRVNGNSREYKINFIPCIPLRELPKQIKISVPIPNRRPHLEKNTQFKREVMSEIEKGKELFCLEARLFKWNIRTKFESSIAVSWHVGTTQLEDKAYKKITQLSNATFFANVILLLGQIKSKRPKYFHALSNRMILNAVLHTHRKHMGELHKSEEWFMAVLSLLLTQTEVRCAPAFFLNKLNLLPEGDERYWKYLERELRSLIKDLKSNPESLYDMTGYVEKTDDNDSLDDQTDDEKRTFEEETQFESSDYITDTGRRGSDDSSEAYGNESDRNKSLDYDERGDDRYDDEEFEDDDEDTAQKDDTGSGDKDDKRSDASGGITEKESDGNHSGSEEQGDEKGEEGENDRTDEDGSRNAEDEDDVDEKGYYGYLHKEADYGSDDEDYRSRDDDSFESDDDLTDRKGRG